MKNWYAIYVRPRAEKRVRDSFEKSGINYFLPMNKTLRQWSDRKKWVELPVISGYAFVNINSKNRLQVLQTDFVLGFVRYLGADAVIPEEQIIDMKRILGQEKYEVDVDFNNYLKGDPVRVINGPLTGLHGHLVSVRNNHKIIIEIEKIRANMILEIPISHIEIQNKKAIH